MTVQVYVGLGANIDPERCLQAGVSALQLAFAQLQLSPVYQTQAVGIHGPDFLNMVVGFETRLSLSALRSWIKQVETQHGRERSLQQPSSHRLDMDVLLYGSLVSSTENVPRNDVLQQAYVLQPLADLAPSLLYPGSQQTIGELWQASDLLSASVPLSLDFNV